MAEYNHKEIELKWQQYWRNHNSYKTELPGESKKPKYYILDMFPYPSGAGLHVGHPLGYIASDILARYKRHCGFNVLHPMGYDSFGLPAEQYAIQTGQHPAITTEQNIKRFREQLDVLGFSYDWDREVRTSDPSFYKWTQWIFIQLFHSWYNNKTQKAASIENLIAEFNSNGNGSVNACCEETKIFSAGDWKQMSEAEQQQILMNYRLAYLGDAYVNWCATLGSVLANDEVKDGVSERGGYLVERKLMRQWSLRISAYSQRLLDGLDGIDWSDSIKDAQRYWIGKSEGCSVKFKLANGTNDASIEVFTTRPDTIYGVTFVTLAPEHELISTITSDDCKAAVEQYVTYAKNRSERERQSEVKNITGQFTGAYVAHPFTNENIPVWIGDYVLAGYGTGAVMGVPAHDTRDHAFAKHFTLSIKQVISAPKDWVIDNEAYDAKEGICINSDLINGLEVKDAIKKIIGEIEKRNIGKGQVNYRLRDAVFGRQRYWGEPIPVYYKDGIAHTLPVNELPLRLPEVDTYQPTETGEPPLARAKDFKYRPHPQPLSEGEGSNEEQESYPLEHTTMPGWAGSSWYYLRYMDAHNNNEFASKEATDYWQEIDFYLGGAEHATGHLIYFRFWTKFLKDLGCINIDEPAKKLVNQGMIQGTSALIYRINNTNQYVSYNLRKNYETTALHVDVNMVSNSVLDLEKLKLWREDFTDAEFILEDGKYICGSEVEKMSKRWYNVVNPEDIVEQYGADCLRMYEMFLGPLEQHKPWNTNGITGVNNFLKKIWRLFETAAATEFGSAAGEPSNDELKVINRTIKKITDDVERYSYNTAVSSFMICTNELNDLKCTKRSVLEPLVILLSPFAPHIAEELWKMLGNSESVTKATWPKFDEKYLKDSTHDYPVSINGKVRFKITIDLAVPPAEVEKIVLASEQLPKYLTGAAPKKIIIVPGKIVNVVL